MVPVLASLLFLLLILCAAALVAFNLEKLKKFNLSAKERMAVRCEEYERKRREDEEKIKARAKLFWKFGFNPESIFNEINSRPNAHRKRLACVLALYGLENRYKPHQEAQEKRAQGTAPLIKAVTAGTISHQEYVERCKEFRIPEELKLPSEVPVLIKKLRELEQELSNVIHNEIRDTHVVGCPCRKVGSCLHTFASCGGNYCKCQCAAIQNQLAEAEAERARDEQVRRQRRLVQEAKARHFSKCRCHSCSCWTTLSYDCKHCECSAYDDDDSPWYENTPD